VIHQQEFHKWCPQPCEICGERFTTEAQRNDHLVSSHPDIYAHKCGLCNKGFLTKDRLQFHQLHIHPDSEWTCTCEVCGKICKSYKTLKIHLVRDHVDPSLAVSCPTCGVEVKHAKLLEYHMLSHAPPSFLCETCGYAAKTQMQLAKHNKSVHCPTRAFKCTHCPHRTKTKHQLQMHIGRHFGANVKPCPHCGIEKNANDLYNHITIVHKGRKYMCAHCAAMFTLRTHLKKHYVQKHPDVTIPLDADLEVTYTKTPEETSTPVVPPPAKRPKKGPHPDKAKQPEEPTSVALLYCSTCPLAIFETPTDLEEHMLRHEEDPVFKIRDRSRRVQRLNLSTSDQGTDSQHSSSLLVRGQSTRTKTSNTVLLT